MGTNQTYKYYAFISYNSGDTNWGKRLQRKLENYSMPSTLCNKHGWKRRPMKPVFFAPTDIQPGGLTAELQERLKASRHLVVICSPRSARSKWVGQEIAFFHSLGRTANIHFFIVDGIPHSGDEATECFNPVVDELGLPEILSANIHEKVFRWAWLNRQRAYVQLITKMLGVEFDSVWQRHKRMLVRRTALWVIAVTAVLAALVAVWSASQPVDVSVSLNEASTRNPNLPPLHDAVVTITLDNETKSDTIATLGSRAEFTNIPSRFIGENVRLSIACPDFLPIDTTIILTKDMVFNISRDARVYGGIRFRLWNSNTEQTVGGCQVEIAGYTALSDENGLVELAIPLEKQKTTYEVKASTTLADSIIYTPCGSDDVLIVTEE